MGLFGNDSKSFTTQNFTPDINLENKDVGQQDVRSSGQGGDFRNASDGGAVDVGDAVSGSVHGGPLSLDERSNADQGSVQIDGPKHADTEATASQGATFDAPVKQRLDHKGSSAIQLHGASNCTLGSIGSNSRVTVINRGTIVIDMNNSVAGGATLDSKHAIGFDAKPHHALTSNPVSNVTPQTSLSSANTSKPTNTVTQSAEGEQGSLSSAAHQSGNVSDCGTTAVRRGGDHWDSNIAPTQTKSGADLSGMAAVHGNSSCQKTDQKWSLDVDADCSQGNMGSKSKPKGGGDQKPTSHPRRGPPPQTKEVPSHAKRGHPRRGAPPAAAN